MSLEQRNDASSEKAKEAGEAGRPAGDASTEGAGASSN